MRSGCLDPPPPIMIRASSAVAPWPAACTISGLTSTSAMSGRARIRRPSAAAAAATASTSTGGELRKPCSSFAVLSLPSSSTISSLGQIRRHQPHVAERLDPDAAEPDHHHRPPSRIAARADDELKPARRHGFHQHAIEFQAGLRALHICMQSPAMCALHGSALATPSTTPPASVLCVKLRGLRLHRHRITDAIGDVDRRRGAGGEFARGYGKPIAASTFLPSHSGCVPCPSSGIDTDPSRT